MAIQYNSNFDTTIPFSDVNAQVALGVGVAQSFAVPGPATTNYSVKFSYTSASNVFVRLNVAPVTPPPATVTSLQYTEFRPGDDGSQRYVKGGDTLYFITPDATAYVGISLRQLP